MEYGTCVSSCQRRCSSLSVPQRCGGDCEEGCVCPQGSFYNHRTHTCVHRLCPPGQLYLNCSDGENNLTPGRGVACERTCESFLLNITCSAHEPCVSGCACPPGVKVSQKVESLLGCVDYSLGVDHPGQVVSDMKGKDLVLIRDTAFWKCIWESTEYLGCAVQAVSKSVSSHPQSSADVMLNVMAENVDCFDSGIICRKSLLINIGGSFISFDDDSGKLGKLSGLCGNFDLKTINEMRTPDNIDSPTPQEFGNSWTATEVDVTWFYMNCLADTCACSRGGDCECFCTSVAAYAQRCCHEGIPVDWRSPSLCRKANLPLICLICFYLTDV
ncbi:hypothetical protein GOODEAATRI_004945 [Goodea atripinnis]|uniref:VWF/SSPO/Zonadhesin-like cysteine-rich domain-containing protein n=1 Tax=Goodea atripinnis TaxID=208336 RepID=A0ABV0PBE8_9TELE